MRNSLLERIVPSHAICGKFVRIFYDGGLRANFRGRSWRAEIVQGRRGPRSCSRKRWRAIRTCRHRVSGLAVQARKRLLLAPELRAESADPALIPLTGIAWGIDAAPECYAFNRKIIGNAPKALSGEGLHLIGPHVGAEGPSREKEKRFACSPITVKQGDGWRDLNIIRPFARW
jgi:hypothetical protein